MKTFSVVVTIILSLGVLFGTTEVLAQTGSDPQQFDSQIGENGATGSQFVPCSGTNCSACHFVSLANNIVDWLIMMLALVFTIIVIVSASISSPLSAATRVPHLSIANAEVVHSASQGLSITLR